MLAGDGLYAMIVEFFNIRRACFRAINRAQISTFLQFSHPMHYVKVAFTQMRGMNSDTKARFLGLMGLGSIAVWLTLSIGNAFYLSLVSLHWPKVSARVIASGLDTGRSTIGAWWSPDVVYEYGLDGHEYRSSTIRYVMPPSYEENEAQAILATYPVDAQISVAYDPRNPARSVLEPGIPPLMWLKALIPVFFWGLTAYIYYEIVHPERRLMLRSNPEILEREAWPHEDERQDAA